MAPDRLRRAVRPFRRRSPADGFPAMLAAVDAAQLELQSGKPAAFKALWSRRDDITLSGGFGGTIERGWEAVGRRLDWVGTQFSKGSNSIERLVAQESGDLGQRGTARAPSLTPSPERRRSRRATTA